MISRFRTIAERSVARGETRVLPIAIGGKNPAIKWKGSKFDTTSTEEWAGLVSSWICEQEINFANLNACVLAKPNECLFLDIDTAKAFHEGYEKFTGHSYPVTFTTS